MFFSILFFEKRLQNSTELWHMFGNETCSNRGVQNLRVSSFHPLNMGTQLPIFGYFTTTATEWYETCYRQTGKVFKLGREEFPFD